jgi:hypothetical protein
VSTPSSGITAEVIRDIMHPYHLSADLLEATLAAIPAPPPDAPTTWRLARLTRLADEIVAPKPANAEQARIAAEILITRELANALAHRAHAPGRTDEQMCRLARTTDRLLQTAVSLGRSLAASSRIRRPSSASSCRTRSTSPRSTPPGTPNPNTPTQPPRRAAAPPPPEPARQPKPPADHPDAPPPAIDPSAMTPPPQLTNITTTEPSTQPGESPATAAHPDQDTGPEWSFTKLDEGPGWSREVLRHRSHREPANNAKPDSTT